MRKLLLCLMLFGSASAQAAMFISPTVGQLQASITLEDYKVREKHCKDLGGAPTPKVSRFDMDKVVVIGLLCKYNDATFDIPEQQEKIDAAR